MRKTLAHLRGLNRFRQRQFAAPGRLSFLRSWSLLSAMLGLFHPLIAGTGVLRCLHTPPGRIFQVTIADGAESIESPKCDRQAFGEAVRAPVGRRRVRG